MPTVIIDGIEYVPANKVIIGENKTIRILFENWYGQCASDADFEEAFRKHVNHLYIVVADFLPKGFSKSEAMTFDELFSNLAKSK